MSTEPHPSELNSLQLYNRTVNMARKTSRLKNQDWYRNALELDLQVHMYLSDESGVNCFLYVKSKNHYQKIDNLNQSQVEKYSELEKYIDYALDLDEAKGAKSLGFVLYLADELSIAGLGPEHQNPAELSELRDMMVENPTEILEDKTVSSETHSWRLFPYPGATEGSEFATAVAVSRKSSNMLKMLREIGCEKNIPIRTTALSAPLNAIAALPWFVSANENGTIVVLNYRKFTLLGMMNRSCDLTMLRYMPHPNGGNAPSNLGAAALASASAFELESPEINVFAMEGQNVDSLIVSLQNGLMSSDIVIVDTVETFKSKSLPENLPVEMVATTQELDAEIYPLSGNTTFCTLKEEKWHLQDFLEAEQEEVDMFPGAKDMKLLKLGRQVKKIAAILLLVSIAYGGFSSWRKLASDEWSYKEENTQATASALVAKIKHYEHWDNLLQDRSKAWVCMELIQKLVPSDGSVILKDVTHRVGQKSERGIAKYGLNKEWFINGYTNEQGIKLLESYGTREGVKKIFLEVAVATGNEAYLTDVGSRDITVSFKQQSNPTYNTLTPTGPGDTMPYAFKLQITQSFGASDGLAIAGVKTIPVK